VSRCSWTRDRGWLLLAAAAVAWAGAASCRTAAPRSPVNAPVPGPTPHPAAEAKGPVLPGPDVGRFAPLPNLRVGILTDVGRVSVGTDRGVVVWGQNPDGGWSGRRIETARATFVAVAAGGGTPRPRQFAVQVGSFADEAGARVVAAKAQATAGLPASVTAGGEASRYSARVGQFASRDEAQGMATRLHREGFPGSFVVQEGARGPRGGLRLVETGDELAGATVVPAVEGDRLAADANAYRGAFEVRSAEGGALNVINVVGLQDYLKGVVPNELSPQVFPQIEALKAQAIAARTYALRNRGQFAAQGYDLCATPTCQVYRGLSTENPLSSQAVDETRGQVATYKGELINALYTSTCGGHTEDAANIFEEGAPYLTGVVCAPERESWAEVRTTVRPHALGDHPDLTRSVALLTSLGVLEPRDYEPSFLRGIPKDAEIRAWGTRVSLALRRKGCRSGSEGALARRGSFFDHLVGVLCWEERAARLLSAGDEAYLLKVEDRAAFAGPAERRAAALLVSEGALSPFPDNTLRPGTAITRGQAFVLLARALEKAGPPELRSAKFEALAPEGFTVAVGEARSSYPLDPGVRLYRNLDGATAAASAISLGPGDGVKFVLRAGQIVYLEVSQTRHGVAADRDSRYYRWEVRLTPEEVGRGVARYGRVGIARELEPRKIGVSGRIVELLVRGSEGDLLLRGLRVRWGLGLRENLFVIERERDASGKVLSFLFTGKGWGHGVGLCQVGAFGMAKTGATSEEILKHYYSGIALEVRN
jgi:peptidoglycan hydrolase-like amidase